jgi:peptide/nickel transport system substrate-binding protein
MPAPRTSSGGFTRRTVLGGSLAAATALLIDACARAAGSSGTGSSGKTTVTIGVPTDIVPTEFLRQVAVNQVVVGLVFESLMQVDLVTDQPLPGVATSWRWNTDKTQLTVDLRDDVRFHTGRAFGPEDVIFSIKKVQDPTSGAQTSPIAQKISAMTASGPHQVTFVLAEPISNFFDLLTITPMIDSETYSGLASGTHVVGTGPFAWKNWTPGTSVSLARFGQYWQPGKPAIDNVLIRVYSQAQALLAAIESKQITMAYQIVPRDAAKLAKGSYTISTSAPQFTDWYVGVNVAAAPFTDIRARQAVAYALDRDRITSQVFAGYGQPTCVPWPDTSPGLSAADTTYYTYDLARAKQLFAAAGAPTTPIPLVTNGGNATMAALLNIVQYNLESAGFKVDPQLLDTATYQAQLQAASIKGLWIGSVDLVSVSIATAMLGTSTFKAAKNTSHVTDPQYAALAKKVTGATTTADLATANRGLTDYLLDQAFHLTVAHGVYVAAYDTSLTGITHNTVLDLILTSAKVS